MKTKANFSKRVLSLMLSALMVGTMLPTFVFSSPTTAEAQDAPASSYWSILASTDFTQSTWSGSGSDYTSSWNPTTSAGGNQIGWGAKYGTHNGGDGVEVNKNEDGTAITTEADKNGVCFPWHSDSYKHQGMLYMKSYNSQTTDTIFKGVENFKIDLAFSFLGTAKCNTGYTLSDKANDVPLLKLARDSGNKYTHRSQYNHQSNYFIQTAWGERSIDSTDYYVDGKNTETEGTTTGGKWAITTSDNNASSVLTTNTTYHYIVYVADKMLGCYVTDDSGNVLINYNPIELGSYNMSPADISSIYLGASEFNWAGKYDIENIAYKSIEIYKGVDSHSYDSSRDKFLYAYFTGNDEAGETMHYAISQDGVNFETVSGGAKVWNSSNYPATETFPTTDSAPYSDSVAITNHVRDSYAFIGRDGKDYIIATDLKTNNWSGSVQNSRFLLWKMDNFADIADTKPISIDTSKLPGMDAITGGTSGTHKTVKKAWAPQVIYDTDMGKYMLYWSVGADGIATQVYYTYTSDFKSDFTTVKRLMYPDFAASGITNHIDADITYHNGLYYCYFKNEDGSGTGSKRIWYAVAPNANGPYTDFELINTSYGAEGPQVYETGNGSYMLMIDGYGDGTYHMYSAGTPYDFDISDETTTNVTSLSPRHGSIVRITDAEYQKLKKLRIGEELRYDWQTEGSYAHNTPQTDSTGNAYHVTWNPSASTTTTGNGVLSITDSGMYSELTTVQNFIASDVYSVTFNYKSNGSTARDDNHSIFSISHDDSGAASEHVQNYVRLSSNGKFIVNNSQVAVSGNCSDGTTTRAAKFSSAVNDTANFHKFTVTSDGLITSLIIDGEFICQTVSGMDIPNTLWITFGWARINPGENNRLTAQFGQVIFKNVATETDKQDEIYDTLKPANLNIPTFGQTAYHHNAEATDGTTKYYSNVVYCKHDTNSNGDNNTVYSGEIDYNCVKFKIAYPKKIVLVYDGARTASLPVYFEIKRASNNDPYIHWVSVNDNGFVSNTAWHGYNDSNYRQWPSGSTLIGSGSGNQVNMSVNFTSSRRWGTKIDFEGPFNTDEYLRDNTKISFYVDLWSKKNDNDYGPSESDSPSADHYVLNYKPIYDILSGTTKVKVDGATSSSVTISSLFTNDADSRWKYTKASYEQALYAMKLLNECNPNNFLSNSTADGDVATQATACANAIKKAKAEFDKINLITNKFHITYRMADGTTKAEVVTAGNNLANVPSNTANYHIFDSEQHKKNCTWTSVTNDPVPSGASAYSPATVPVNGAQPKASTIYTETGTVENCNHNTACDHVAAAGDVNGYTDYKCSVCSEIYEKNRVWDTVDSETHDVLAERWTVYSSKANSIEEKHVSSEYTTDSRGYYFTAATAAISGVTANDPSKSETYINNRISALTTAESMLNPLAEYEKLIERQETRGINNYVGDVQQYTYDSWMNFATTYDTKKTTIYDAAPDKSNIGMYEVNASTHVVNTGDKTDEQEAIEGAYPLIENAYDDLAACDKSDEKYSVFNNAKIVADNVDTDKFTDAAVSAFNTAKTNTYNAAYHKLTSSDYEKYNAATGGRSFAPGAEIRNSVNVDVQTTAMLSAITELNSHVKQLWVTLTVQDEDGNVIGGIDGTGDYKSTVSYGTSQTFTLPDVAALNGKSVNKWSVTNYSYNDAHTSESAVSSSKISGVNNPMTKVVTNNIAVLAIVSDDVAGESQKKVIINNPYGNVKDVYYVSDGTSLPSGSDIDDSHKTITFGSYSATADQIPFYTFNGWTLKSDDANKVYSYTPTYRNAPSFNFTFVGATQSDGTFDYDNKVTVNYDSDIEDIVKSKNGISNAEFKAWAVSTASGKYQIASYNSDYFFFACADENFVPIMNVGTSESPIYKAVTNADGTLSAELAASMIDADIPSYADIDADSVLKNKLNNSLPFVAVQNSKIDGSKARVYVRVSTGSSNLNGFGVIIKNNAASGEENTMKQGDSGVLKRTVTNILETGQFTYTLNNKYSNTYEIEGLRGQPKNFDKPIGFRGFVNYNISYKSTSVNAIEYSNGSRATID